MEYLFYYRSHQIRSGKVKANKTQQISVKHKFLVNTELQLRL